MNLLNGYINNDEYLLHINSEESLLILLLGDLTFFCVFLKNKTFEFLEKHTFWNVV